ncbi:MAG: hypothetical protein ACI9TO_000155, partial [Rickettsiales bacterium]
MFQGRRRAGLIGIILFLQKPIVKTDKLIIIHF